VTPHTDVVVDCAPNLIATLVFTCTSATPRTFAISTRIASASCPVRVAGMLSTPPMPRVAPPPATTITVPKPPRRRIFSAT
jgi:hypothetical protein